MTCSTCGEPNRSERRAGDIRAGRRGTAGARGVRGRARVDRSAPRQPAHVRRCERAHRPQPEPLRRRRSSRSGRSPAAQRRLPTCDPGPGGRFGERARPHDRRQRPLPTRPATRPGRDRGGATTGWPLHQPRSGADEPGRQGLRRGASDHQPARRCHRPLLGPRPASYRSGRLGGLCPSGPADARRKQGRDHGPDRGAS